MQQACQNPALCAAKDEWFILPEKLSAANKQVETRPASVARVSAARQGFRECDDVPGCGLRAYPATGFLACMAGIARWQAIGGDPMLV